MKELLTNPEIVKLLDGSLPMDKAYDLAYSQVFPCEYLPEVVNEGRTYICFDIDIQQSYDKTFYAPVLYVWVFTHKSQLRLPEGGIRPDKLCSKICEMINGSRKYGLGELNLYSVKRFAPLTDYQGKCLTFHMKEFNKFYDPKKYTPINRKGE